MPNGKPHDNPLSDMTVHGLHPFPPDIEALLWRVDELGKQHGYAYPLGENWPFSDGREFDWERGESLDEARRDLTHLIELLQQGRAVEALRRP
jgi:hypothetical protein